MRIQLKDDLCVIPTGRLLLAVAAGGALFAANAVAQSAREIRDSGRR